MRCYRRLVKDRTIAHAISATYSVATIKERSPEVHLFIEVPPDRVDVNVHPTKAEVRFLDQSLVHEVLRRALIDALGQGGVPELVLSPGAVPPPQPLGTSLPWTFDAPSMPSFGQAVLGVPGQPTSHIPPTPSTPPTRIGIAGGQETVQSLIKPLTPLGQFRNTFILAVDDECIAIIDQHVAHERILFEQIAERLTTGRVEVQALLTPVVRRSGSIPASPRRTWPSASSCGWSIRNRVVRRWRLPCARSIACRRRSASSSVPRKPAWTSGRRRPVRRADLVRKRWPDDPEGHWLVGSFLIGQRADFARGLPLLERAVALDPGRSPSLIRVQLLGDRLDEALETATRFADRSPGSESLGLLTIVRSTRGEVGPALEAANVSDIQELTAGGVLYGKVGFESLSDNGIGSNNIVTASAEVEMKIHRDWSLAAFFDAGNAFNDWGDFELLKGAGVGVRWYSIAGAIRLDFAQALDLEGEPWRVHFTIGTPLL